MAGNPISQFFLDRLVLLYCVSGLAFFSLGLTLLLASRQESSFKFMWAVRYLAGFGLLQALHEWLVMFQMMYAFAEGRLPDPLEDWVRVLSLAGSFILLLFFGHRLLSSLGWRFGIHLAALPVALWLVGSVYIVFVQGLLSQVAQAEVEVLTRYALGIPSTLVACVAFMAQQREFRMQGVTQFGSDLVWCAAAIFLFGVVGHLFPRGSTLPPSDWLNSTTFIQWFGVPVQLVRTVMACLLALFMWRVLLAFEREHERKIAAVNALETSTREQALTAERRARAEESRLNIALQTQARELALLLDLSNLLATPVHLEGRLEQALRQIVGHFAFSDAGLIMLLGPNGFPPSIAATLNMGEEPGGASAASDVSHRLGIRCIEQGSAVCRHDNGDEVSFNLDAVVIGQECWQHARPTVMVAFPLAGQAGTSGALVLARQVGNPDRLQLPDLRLLAAIGHQIGLAVDNARLFQDVQGRERLLGNMLHQVVHVQEAERQRIARELHDATGQSLSAITLGLRGIETSVARQAPDLLQPLATVFGFANDALIELRRLISDLRPPQLDDLGLGPALQWYVQSIQGRHPELTIKLLPPASWPRLSPERETLLFRIVQESLNNAVRHAQATSIQISVTSTDDTLIVRIKDDGRGFHVPHALGRNANAWGLLGMRERAQLMGGTVDICSTVGEGSEIVVTTPVERNDAEVMVPAMLDQKA